MKKILFAMCLVIGMSSGVMAETMTGDLVLNTGAIRTISNMDMMLSAGDGDLVLTGVAPQFKFVDTGAVSNIFTLLDGNSPYGSFYINCDPNNIGSGTQFGINVDGSNAFRLTSGGNGFFSGYIKAVNEISLQTSLSSSFAFAQLDAAGLAFGSGTAARDTNLYRSAANILKTDDSFIIGGSTLEIGKNAVSSKINMFANVAVGENVGEIYMYNSQSSATNQQVALIAGKQETSNGGCLKFMTKKGSVWNEGMTLTSAGNLVVNGTVTAKEVLVKTNVWSDYVFAPGYNLMPLSEVESYVKTNQHLPGIPTEAEVKKDGVNIGDVQAKLLAKIEELTLYVIEQNKKLEAQDQKYAELQAQNEKLAQRVSYMEKLASLSKK